MRILLISNSGKPLYHWCKDEIMGFAKNKQVAFISWATIKNQDEYYQEVKEALAGLKLDHLRADNAGDLIEKTDVFLVGGGNTYHLLSKLREHNLLDKIKKRVLNGASYIGVSAGANIAGPNILTTNDWNVVGLKSFEGLSIVPFNINPHYVDPHDKKVFSGESRDDRIFEYLTFNNNPVIGIEEKTFLRIENEEIKVEGFGKVKVFEKGKEPKEFKSGDYLDL